MISVHVSIVSTSVTVSTIVTAPIVVLVLSSIVVVLTAVTTVVVTSLTIPTTEVFATTWSVVETTTLSIIWRDLFTGLILVYFTLKEGKGVVLNLLKHISATSLKLIVLKLNLVFQIFNDISVATINFVALLNFFIFVLMWIFIPISHDTLFLLNSNRLGTDGGTTYSPHNLFVYIFLPYFWLHLYFFIHFIFKLHLLCCNIWLWYILLVNYRRRVRLLRGSGVDLGRNWLGSCEILCRLSYEILLELRSWRLSS